MIVNKCSMYTCLGVSHCSGKHRALAKATKGIRFQVARPACTDLVPGALL